MVFGGALTLCWSWRSLHRHCAARHHTASAGGDHNTKKALLALRLLQQGKPTSACAAAAAAADECECIGGRAQQGNGTKGGDIWSTQRSSGSQGGSRAAPQLDSGEQAMLQWQLACRMHIALGLQYEMPRQAGSAKALVASTCCLERQAAIILPRLAAALMMLTGGQASCSQAVCWRNKRIVPGQRHAQCSTADTGKGPGAAWAAEAGTESSTGQEAGGCGCAGSSTRTAGRGSVQGEHKI